MILGLSKLKWTVIFLLIPMASIAANSNGFVLQLKGPEGQISSSRNSYGPVVKADTLWSVANATRPNRSISLYKTMAAILAFNPNAFLGGDINKMIDGSILIIPSLAEIQATDGSALQSALSKKSAVKAKPVKANPKTVNDSKIPNDKLTLLQGELTTSNEHLLLSTETNRRLKLQLESIRIELAELKQQIEIDNNLKADLRALIEQQQAQIAEQQIIIDDAKNKAKMDVQSNNNWWMIAGVSGVISLLSLVWLGLWLKNRNDQKNNVEDNVMFDADNTVDELSDYLNAENYAAEPAVESSIVMAEEPAASSAKYADENNSPAVTDLDEPNFNLQMEQEAQVFVDEVNDLSIEPVETLSTAPIMPEVIEQPPLMPELSVDNDDFSDIDLTLDDESTSFEHDSIEPDLSWREDLDIEQNTTIDEPSLIPEQPVKIDDKITPLEADLAEVDSMLAQFKLENAPKTNAVQNAASSEENSSEENNTENSTKAAVKDDTQAASAEKIATNDDIDSLLADAGLDAIAQVSDAKHVENEQFVDMDDIDSLLADAGLDAIAQVSDAKPVDSEQVVDMDDIDSLLADAGLDAIAQVSDAKPVENEQVVDMDDIDSILASAGLEDTAVDTGADSDELPQAHGQTVDEMLAELDGVASASPEPVKQPSQNDEPLDDIEAMLAEYSPNAFSNEPSEQAPIDVAAAQAEEFIDIDKLLNEASQQPANVEDEPYDQVKLDVGLDEFSNSLFDNNGVDIDDENNRFSAQLDLARAYLEIEDKDGAKSILEPLAGAGDAVQQAEVNKLLSRLA